MESNSWEQLVMRMKQSMNVEGLRVLRDEAHDGFRGHLLFSIDSNEHKQINEMHDAIIHRCVELTERAVGPAPVTYAFIVFGSGGRGEQTLWSDQDNGLIYDTPKPDKVEATEQYFVRFADTLVSHLEKAGYPPCEGNVLCTNPKWRKPLSEWKDMLLDWLENPDWENVRYLLIASDLRCIYGNNRLIGELQNFYLEYVRNHPSILIQMLRNTLHHKVSIGVFGQIIRERYGMDAGGFDVKYGAYIPFVNGIRLLAIENEIKSTSTEERLQALIELGKIPEVNAGDWLKAWKIAQALRAITPCQVEEGMYSSRGKLTAEQMTKEVVHELKLCLKMGAELQKFVKKIEKKVEVRSGGGDE